MGKKGLIVLGIGIAAFIAATLIGVGPCAGTMTGFYFLWAGLAGMALGGLILVVGFFMWLIRKPNEPNPSS